MKKKWAEELSRHFLPKENGQEVHEKMFNMPNHEANAN